MSASRHTDFICLILALAVFERAEKEPFISKEIIFSLGGVSGDTQDENMSGIRCWSLIKLTSLCCFIRTAIIGTWCYLTHFILLYKKL